MGMSLDLSICWCGSLTKGTHVDVIETTIDYVHCRALDMLTAVWSKKKTVNVKKVRKNVAKKSVNILYSLRPDLDLTVKYLLEVYCYLYENVSCTQMSVL